MTRTNRQGGLTLLEMLIGMVIGLILLGGVYLVHSSAWATWTTNDTLLTLGQETSAALNRVATELREAYADCVVVSTENPNTPNDRLDVKLVLNPDPEMEELELTKPIVYRRNNNNQLVREVRADTLSASPVGGCGNTTGGGGPGGTNQQVHVITNTNTPLGQTILANHVDTFSATPDVVPPAAPRTVVLRLATQTTTSTGRTLRYPADANGAATASFTVTFHNGNPEVMLPPEGGNSCAEQECGGGSSGGGSPGF